MKKLILVLCLGMVFFGCGKEEVVESERVKLGDYFEKDNNGVYYTYPEGEEYELKDADPKTFQVLKSSYAKDKKNVYWTTSKIDNADIETFEVIDGVIDYAKDKNHVYTIWIALDNVVDPETFEFINDSVYAKDKEKVYFRADQGELGVAENANPETFEIIKFENERSHFAKDDKNFYYDGSLLKDIDYDSFKVLSENYAIDKNNVYYLYYHYFFNENGKVEFKDDVSPDLESFEYLDLGNRFFRDDSFIYKHDYYGYEGKSRLSRKDEFDVNTFKVFNEYYVKDKNNVYYLECMVGFYCMSKVVENADLETFEIVSGRWARDKSNCYFDGIIEDMEGCKALKRESR